jgi:chromate transporter
VNRSARRPAHLGELFRAFSGMAMQGFGGVLGVVHRELVERRGWLDEQAFAGDWATAQVLPGPNVCNLALIYGWRQFGWRGALTALAGLLLAPTLLLLLLATALDQIGSWPVVRGAIAGLSAVATGLVAGAGLRLGLGLASHPLGRGPAVALAALALAMLLGAGLPMVGVVLLIGGPVCVLTWRRLRPPR